MHNKILKLTVRGHIPIRIFIYHNLDVILVVCHVGDHDIPGSIDARIRTEIIDMNFNKPNNSVTEFIFKSELLERQYCSLSAYITVTHRRRITVIDQDGMKTITFISYLYKIVIADMETTGS